MYGNNSIYRLTPRLSIKSDKNAIVCWKKPVLKELSKEREGF